MSLEQTRQLAEVDVAQIGHSVFEDIAEIFRDLESAGVRVASTDNSIVIAGPAQMEAAVQGRMHRVHLAIASTDPDGEPGWNAHSGGRLERGEPQQLPDVASSAAYQC